MIVVYAGTEPITDREAAILAKGTLPVVRKYAEWAEENPELVALGAVATVYAPRLIAAFLK